MNIYLWVDNNNPTTFYLTDYVKNNSDGLTWIDNVGWKKVTLMHTGKSKVECMAFVQKLIEKP
jgi:hypothetical protein